MTIYKITESSSINASSFEMIENNGIAQQIEILIPEVDTANPLDVDYEYMKNKYGISISIEEIRIYLGHKEAWNAFLSSEEKFCLIIEENVSIIKSIQAIFNKISDISDNWDIIFPFDKTKIKEKPKNQPYLLGYYWGSCVYFLSKEGVQKLLSLNQIRQPLDDELLELSSKDELNVYCEDTHWFDIDFSKSFTHIGRLREIHRTMETYNAWSDKNRKSIRKILKIIAEISSNLNISLVLHGGSLLGAVQHDAIIPWDDDIDLGIEQQNFLILQRAIEEDKRLQIDAILEKRTNTIYYKIWSEKGEAINNYSYKFPFVDLWLYKKEGRDILFNNGIVFPNVYKYGFKNILFEESRFDIPINYIECLDSMYDEWKIKFKVYPWSHRLEKFYFKPFQIGILTDYKGRFLNYSIY